MKKMVNCKMCGCRFAAKAIDGLPLLARLRGHMEDYHPEQYLALRLRVWRAAMNRLPNELRTQI